MTDMIASHWDPFTNTRPVDRDVVADPGDGIKLPGWITTGFLILSLFAVAGFLATIIWPEAAWFAVPALCISVTGMIGAELLKKTGKKRDWRFYQLAEENGWSFKLIAPERQRKREMAARPLTSIRLPRVLMRRLAFYADRDPVN